MKILRWLYTLSKVIRATILISVFGSMSSCKHSPTCGEYTMELIEKKGFLIGLTKGMHRVITCY